MGDTKSTPPGVKLPTPVQAQQWEQVAPGTFKTIMDEICREERHRQRMEAGELCSRFFGQLCAFGSVAVLAVLAKYFVDHDAPTQGASIIATGAVSIVAVFVTGRLSKRGQ